MWIIRNFGLPALLWHGAIRIKPCAEQAVAKVNLHIAKIYAILFCRRFILRILTMAAKGARAVGMSAANTGDNAV
jgi:hypothetical protein